MSFRNLKRISLSVMSFVLAATMCACGNTPSESSAPDNTAAQNTESTQTPENTDNNTADGEIVMNKDLTSIEVADLMGNGINLGNTMEAYGHKSLGVSADPTSYETLWGQPITTQEIVTAMKDAGFDSLRIPVAWTNAMDFENGDYTIGTAYMDRVQTIVDYAINADMYVILNDHWDGGWWGMFGSATEETRNKAMELYVSMWTQICERFKGYSEKLIFESANEELGDRLNDKDYASDSGTLSPAECYQKLLEINQKFVDVVRTSGGNNADRFLLIAGYNTDIKMTCDNRYKMPTDTAKDKLLVSVHYYTPWDYCGVQSVTHWGSLTEYNQQNDLLGMMSKFTEQGYGVVIGEYAVALDGSKPKENTDDFIENMLNNCDYYGYCPMLWDCSSLFKRSTLSFIDDGIAELFKSRSYSAQSSKTAEEIKTDARKALDEAVAQAEKIHADANPLTDNPDATYAWIMINSGDFNIAYSVGDVYDPTAITDGVIATDTEVTGAGTYTVGLDFTGTDKGAAKGIAFSALGLTNGETQYPGCIIDIKSVLINGEEYELVAKPYTSSDNGKCTRVNLYNAWVSSAPPEARTADGDNTGISPVIIDGSSIGRIETISITFELIVPEVQ